MNRTELEGILESKDALRYTLASVPVLEFVIRYAGEVKQAQSKRKLSFAARAIAVGDIAKKLSDEELGLKAVFIGFLAASSPRSQKLVLNITEYEKGV